MNEDNFVFRYDPQRIFLMDYDRRTEEEFESADFRFRGGKLLVGIESSSRLYAKQSDSTQFLAFRSPDGLFRYDSRAKSCVRFPGQLYPSLSFPGRSHLPLPPGHSLPSGGSHESIQTQSSIPHGSLPGIML